MTYNLLDEDWIPVLYRDGRWKRVGIRKALEDAGQIRQIAASNPMDRVAIFRFLLALLYWCNGSPPDDGNDPFPPDWLSKLDDNRDCFSLLGEGKRFYQDRETQRCRSATDLLQEIPTGNNFWHFQHSTDTVDGLCPACCALGLLRLPLFSVSGLPDLKAGINGTPPVYVVPLGMSLMATLSANWVPCKNLGIPAWLRFDVRPIPGEDVPLLTGLTLLSRRVLLHEPVDQPSVCIGCGARETPIILTCEFQSAGKQETEHWNDPHVLYSDASVRRALKAPDLRAAGKFKMDRPWPDLLTRIAERHRFKPQSLLVVGFATGQALNIDVWERTISVPSTVASEGTPCLISRWEKECSSLIRRLRPPGEDAPSRKHVELPTMVTAIRPHVEDRISGRAQELISGSEESWERAAREYRPMMGMVAGALSPGFTTNALQRRKQIANVMPDMPPKSESVKKPGRRKGRDK